MDGEEVGWYRWYDGRMTYHRICVICLTVLAFVAQTVFADVVPDTTFNTNLGDKISNGGVYFVEIQDDGKILVGGTFTSFNGSAAGRLIRLNADGTPDTTFNTALGTGFANSIQWVEQLSDGRIVVAGNFNAFNGNTRGRVVVLNDDGTEDATFLSNTGTGVAGSTVTVIEELSDGDLLIGGAITGYNGVTRANLIRLNSDGTEDTAFAGNLPSVNNFVRGIEVQDSGKIVISGNFTSFGTGAANRVARINADGTEDTTFAANIGTGFDAFVFRSDQDSDGNLYFAGNFTAFNGTPSSYVAKLSEDGVLDTTFTTNIGTGSNDDTLSIRYSTSSDSVYIAGNSSMTSFDGETANRIARISLDGEFDTDFGADMGTGFNGQMQYAFPYDNHVYVAGTFTTFNAASSTRLTRFVYTPPDTTDPTMTITSASSSPVSGAFPITFTASEDINEFDSSDVSVTNGVLSDFQNTVASTTWTAVVTPSANGAVTVTVAAGAFEDLVGNEISVQAQLGRTATLVGDEEEEVEEERSSRPPSGRRSRNVNTSAGVANDVTQKPVVTNTSGNIATVRDLEYGMSGDDVKQLQTVLISLGYSIPAGPTYFFGGQTQAALSLYQSQNGVNPSVGYFGSITRAKMKITNVEGLWW